MTSRQPPEPAAEVEPAGQQTSEPTADTCAPARTVTPTPPPVSLVASESTPEAIPDQTPGASAVSPGWGHLAESDHSSGAERELAVGERPRDTTRRAGRERRWGRRVVVAVVTLALMGVIPEFIARMTIPSESMETTLHGCAGCDNDRVLVDRMVYWFRAPRPGEVVVFTPGPEISDNSEEQRPTETNPLIRGLRAVGRRSASRRDRVRTSSSG